MHQRTVFFWSLVIAMIVLVALAWFTWPTATAVGSVPTMPATAATSTAVVGTTTNAAMSDASLYPPASLGEQNSIVRIDEQTIYVDLAQNSAQQELGLGNRASLGAHQGMLFMFPVNDIHMFWMKDMSFSIDMIWFSADGSVIYIQPNVSPQTYPEPFGPQGVSRYVLEVPANFAADYGIKVGDKAALP